MSAEHRVYPPTSVPTDEDFGYRPAQYVGPVSGSSPEGRQQRRPADIPLDATYRSQVLIWREGQRRRVLLPSQGERGDVPHPWGGPVLVISAWNPHGEPRTLQQNTDDQQRLVSRVSEHAGTVAGRVVAVAPDHGWAEEALVVTGLRLADGRELAAAFGQAALLSWDDAQVAVVPTGAVGQLTAAQWGWQVSDHPVTCPMRLDERPGRQCTVHGGPWTSGAIHAAAVWQSHRALLTSLLGCEVCADGTGPVNGPGGGRGAIMLNPPRLGSRHGGYVW